jgi:hypothetical protein
MQLDNQDKIFKKILKECYWDYKISSDDLKKILNSNDERAQFKLFSKIIYNANDKLAALQIFSKEQLQIFFKNFKATYNKRYINRHIKILKYLLLNEKHHIRGIEWEKI